MKKIVFFMPFIGGGGVEKNLYLITDFLVDKFKDLRVCTVSNNMKKKFNKKIKFISPDKSIYNKFNIRLQYIICLFLLFRFLLSNKQSVVIAFQANIYCIILCKLLNVRIIVRSNSSPSGWYHNKLKKFIYKFIISKADKVIVNSMEFKKEMEKKFNIKVSCIYNPLNKEEIILKSKSGKKDNFFKTKKKLRCLKLLNIGRLTDQKDQITLLKAAKFLKNKLKFKLLILGKGIRKTELNNFIYNNGLTNIVKIRDFTQNPYGIIMQSDFFLLSSRYEGLPNVLLEAAVLKKFIISTNCPTGPKEILLNGKGGDFFEIGNYKDLSDKILKNSINFRKTKSKIVITYKNLKKFDLKLNLMKYYKLIKLYI